LVVHSQNVETINLDTPVLQITNDLNKSSFEHESNHIFSAANKTSSTSYNDIIINCVLEFITSLYTKPTVTEILIQQIIKGVSMLFSGELILHLKNKVMSLLEVCSASDKNEIMSMFNDLENPFLNFKTEYQRMKYFEYNNLIFKSKTIVLGFTPEKKMFHA
jgi:methionine synthase II (cobalamin-independent)